VRGSVSNPVDDDPPGYESAFGAVRARDTQCDPAGSDFVVHQQRERAIAIVEGSETVGDADQSVSADGIAHRENRCAHRPWFGAQTWPPSFSVGVNG
jgi:hypothetical protein